MNKKVKSGNSKLIILGTLVIGLAVAVLTIGNKQDTRSSAAGSNRSACGNCVGDFQCHFSEKCTQLIRHAHRIYQLLG